MVIHEFQAVTRLTREIIHHLVDYTHHNLLVDSLTCPDLLLGNIHLP